MDKETRAKIAKEAAISAVNKGVTSLKSVENIHNMYSRLSESEPCDDHEARRDGLAQALDILKQSK